MLILNHRDSYFYCSASVYKCDFAGQTDFVVTVVDQDNLKSTDSNKASPTIRCRKLLRPFTLKAPRTLLASHWQRSKINKSSDDINLRVS